jgi:hypothetical protein
MLNCVACMQSRRINGTDTLDIVYIAPLTAGNWVGLGFSSTGKMDGSVGLIAVMNSSSSASATWWNLYSHSIGPLSDPSSFLHSSTVQYMSNGNVSISAVVNITAILAPNTPDSLLFALGPVSGSIPLQHSKYTSQVAKFAPAGNTLFISTSDPQIVLTVIWALGCRSLELP